MKQIIGVLMLAGILTLMGLEPAAADITNLQGGYGCTNNGNRSQNCAPNRSIRIPRGVASVQIFVSGQGVNDSKHVSVSGSGVTGDIPKTHFIDPKFGFGTGRADVRITANQNAALGERTVTLTGGGKTFSFNIFIVRNGRVTNMTLPQASGTFTQANLTLIGRDLGQAQFAFQPMTSALSSGAPPPNLTAQIIQNTETRVVIRVQSDRPVTEARGRYTLATQLCRGCGWRFPPTGSISAQSHSNFSGGGRSGGARGTVELTLKSQRVRDITFPQGREVQVGSVLAFDIHLEGPSRQFISGSPPSCGNSSNAVSNLSQLLPNSGFTPPGGGRGKRPPRGYSGERICWRMDPAVFEAVTPTAYNPTAPLNGVRVSPGATFVRMQVRVHEAPANCDPAGCRSNILTRMFRTNVDGSPYRFDKPVTIVPPQP